MNFYTVRDLRTESKTIWENLDSEGEVVITNNGKPTAIMLSIANGNFEEVLKAIRQARAMMAFNNIRKKVAGKQRIYDRRRNRSGISAYRKEKRDANSN